MSKFVKVRNKDHEVVILNADQIVVMRERGVGFTSRMKIKDVLGNFYTSLETPDEFIVKIGAEL